MKFIRWLACSVAASATLVVARPGNAETQRSGDQIYQAFCSSCHATGWNGAPITGIQSDWESRSANGIDTLLANVRQGIATMPPMGTCNDCSDAELRAAIEIMLAF